MKCSLLHAAWTCFIVVTPCIVAGITVGFSSIALPELQLSISDSSWFSSLFTIAAPFGCIFIGAIIDRFGRKASLLVSLIPALIGWYLISYSKQNKEILFIGRFFTGLSSGAVFLPGQAYMAEFIDIDPYLINFRSGFASWIVTASSFGFALVLILGTFFSYQTVALIACALAFCSFFLILLSIPESPVWLYSQGRHGDAEWAQKRLRINHQLNSYLIADKKKERNDSILITLKRRDVYYPLMITTTIFILIMLSGSAIFSSYIINLIDPFNSFSKSYAYILGIVAGIVLFISNVFAVLIIPYTGIRFVGIFGSTCMTLATLSYGLANYFMDTEFKTIAHNISVVSVWIAAFSYGFGYVSIPRALLGELFPVDAKSFATVPAVCMFIVETIVIKMHPYLAVQYGGLPFLFYAFFGTLNALFLYKFLPETVGKSMLELTSEFHDKESDNNDNNKS